VAQAAVPVLPDDTEETLANRVLEQEHVIYPRAVRWFVEGHLSLEGELVRIADAAK
jgi:phosphoribosylglycinamide formyltransferase-1